MIEDQLTRLINASSLQALQNLGGFTYLRFNTFPSYFTLISNYSRCFAYNSSNSIALNKIINQKSSNSQILFESSIKHYPQHNTYHNDFNNDLIAYTQHETPIIRLVPYPIGNSSHNIFSD